jgi:imidazolonepropionase-like amidohydrolase
MANEIVFRSVRIFDGNSQELADNRDVIIADGTIRRIAPSPIRCGEGVEIVDCGGRILMPGFIDAHVHVYAYGLNITRVAQAPATYIAHFAAKFLRSCLDRGFTTVRDVGGADVGLASAIRDGLLDKTPRLLYGGRIISQTGGHGDFRPGDHDLDHGCCACHCDHFTVIADGADAVRRAVREELRRGASHVKLMASGGVASPTDPLERCQYSDEEIRAAVDEATRFGSYVAAHCHPAEAVRRSAELGIRSIEHCTLVDREAAEVVAERGAYAVPTMATLFALLDDGEKLGFPPASMAKLKRVADRALQSLAVLARAGVKMGFGTDLLGPQHERQGTEFSLRARVLPPLEILRSVCSVNAELLNQVGQIGSIREGAMADLLVVDGEPLTDVSVLAQSENLRVIMQGGRIHKRTI